MFGSRKHRPRQAPLTSATANPNAATAALAVFNKHRERSPSLSAAAAAAALRARPITPTNVGEVQTKRTMRRNASVSSFGSAPDLHGRPGLQRRGSSGSMTERTFRTPSPHRPNTSSGGHRQSQSQNYAPTEYMPPVPALPKNIPADKTRSSTGGGQESRKKPNLGIKTTPVRVASQKLGKEGTPSWFGAASVGEVGNIRKTDPAMASPPSSPPQQHYDDGFPEPPRSSSRSSSVNFSYPARMRLGSPPRSPVDGRHSADYSYSVAQSRARLASPPRSMNRPSSETMGPTSQSNPGNADAGLVYDANSRRMVPRLAAVERTVVEASEKPTMARKQKQAQSKAGSHLSQGTMGRTKTNVAYDDLGTQGQQTHHELEAPSREVESAARVSTRHQDEPAVNPLIAAPRTEDAKLEQQMREEPSSAPRNQPQTASTMRRQPSVVKEEPEPESEVEVEPRTGVLVANSLDAVPSRQRVFSNPMNSDSTTASSKPPKLVPNIEPSSQDESWAPIVKPATSPQEPLEERRSSTIAQPAAVQSAKPERAQSLSPVRQAHFGAVSQNLTVKHSPPPRSISPRKSALKQQSPSRGVSPAEHGSDASAGAHLREEQPVSRRKSVRVSFDDENKVMSGHAASSVTTDSPVIPSPQHTTGTRHWYNIGRNKKAAAPLEDDEIMKPRPVLPSFGSVRDKKPRDSSPSAEERPLVRPVIEGTATPPHSMASTPLVPDEASSKSIPEGVSGDQALGALLQQEQDNGTRIPANISRFREPLPPVVTSVEGSGYMSDTSESVVSVPELPSDHVVDVAANESEEETPRVQETRSMSVQELPGVSGPAQTFDKATEDPVSDANVPGISVTQPTPPATQHSAHHDRLGVPGYFPDDESDASTVDKFQDIPTATASTQFGELREAALEPEVQAYDGRTTSSTPATVAATHIPVVDDPSDSETSIYSDAYEDLSDLEGDGFQSLDAVLGTPIRSANPQPDVRKAEPVPASKNTTSPEQPRKLEPEFSIASTAVETPPEHSDEWDRAKAYWRSLTAERRAQLEKEAQEEAGADADLEEVEMGMKPKKKKSIERRNSERKALAVHMAQQMMAKQQQQEEEPASTKERSYMIKPGTKWVEAEAKKGPALRSTMRSPNSQPQARSNTASDAAVPRMRKSLRTNGATDRNQAPAHAVTKKNERPMSYSMRPDDTPRLREQGRRASGTALPTSAASAALTASNPAPVRKTMRRRGSDSSESSFRRARPVSSGQGFGFRSSMRQPMQPSPQASPSQVGPGKRFLRALSPTGSAFRKSMLAEPAPSSAAHMRQTLRSSHPESKPSSIRMPSFGRSSGGGKSTSGGKGARSTRSSRFGDSSDEDAAPSARFRSRFDDSSDEDDIGSIPQPLPRAMATSMRTTAAHRRTQPSDASTALIEEHESEDLPDSGDEEKRERNRDAGVSRPTTQIKRSGSGRGTLALPQTATAPEEAGRMGPTKRHSFMSTFLRRKPDSSRNKVSRPEVVDSAARRDTKLERTADELRDLRRTAPQDDGDYYDKEQEPTSSPPKKQPASPKLQKRMPSYTMPSTGTWPLPSEPNRKVDGGDAADKELGGHGFNRADTDSIDEMRRPSTSGNIGTRTLGGVRNGGGRPDLAQRRTVSSGVLSMDAGLDSAGKKKKKFGALRKMFRLD